MTNQGTQQLLSPGNSSKSSKNPKSRNHGGPINEQSSFNEYTRSRSLSQGNGNRQSRSVSQGNRENKSSNLRNRSSQDISKMGSSKVSKPPVVLTKMRASKRKQDAGRSKSPGNSQAEISLMEGAITAKTVATSGGLTGDLM